MTHDAAKNYIKNNRQPNETWWIFYYKRTNDFHPTIPLFGWSPKDYDHNPFSEIVNIYTQEIPI